MTSNHQTRNLVFPNLFHKIFSVENKLFIGPKRRKNLFWTHEKFFVLFFNCSTEKISWKKLGKTRFVVWWINAEISLRSPWVMSRTRYIYLNEMSIQNHSMAGANLNKIVWLVTNTTAASKYIPRRTRISINWNPPFQTSFH